MKIAKLVDINVISVNKKPENVFNVWKIELLIQMFQEIVNAKMENLRMSINKSVKIVNINV